MPTLPGLSTQQQRVLRDWLPDAVLIADLSWGVVDSTVLRVRSAGEEFVVKAFGASQAHMMRRELQAHREWVAPLRARGASSRVMHHDQDAGLLITSYLPGILVQDTPSERDPGTYHQAGELLAALHGQVSRPDPDHLATETARLERWWSQPHRIPRAQVAAIRRHLAAAHAASADQEWVAVPTHGDYTPRNWLIHDGVVAVIDFGRAGWRPAITDFARLASRQFLGRGDLEEAFLAGYGCDPRAEVGPAWTALLIREAVGVAAWAHQVGDTAFETEGLQSLTRLLGDGGQ